MFDRPLPTSAAVRFQSEYLFMTAFSIDLAAEQIVESKTREHFQEVLGTYANGHYRSAVVTLWSVVVCDLLYKLQALRDLHQNSNAKRVLDEIAKNQSEHPTKSDWENYLVKEAHETLQLLEPAEYTALVHLRDLRHLAAHPVLDATDLLTTPTKECVRAMIRSALEGVLCKPPVFSKNITERFVEDLAAKKDLLPDDSSLKKYLEAKYFKHLRPPVKESLIRALWKFCFSLENSDAETNRSINLRCLKLLRDDDPAFFVATIRKDRDHFSEISHNEIALKALSRFLEVSPGIYRELNDKATAIFGSYLKLHAAARACAFYTSESIEQHLDAVESFSVTELTQLSANTWRFVADACETDDLKERVYKLSIAQYTQSGSYALADAHYDRFIAPLLEQYPRAMIENLLQGIEGNCQTYDRRRSASDHAMIKQRAAAVGVEDFSQYPHFMSSLGGG